MALTNEEVQRELQDMKTKVYLPSSYNDVAARFAELVTNHLNDETRDAFFGKPIENCPLLAPRKRVPSPRGNPEAQSPSQKKRAAVVNWDSCVGAADWPLARFAWGRELGVPFSPCGGGAAVLEAASKNIGKEEFGFMPTKKIFVTSYHTKVS